MKAVFFENQIFKEFETSKEAGEWGWTYFSDVLTPSKSNHSYESVLFYTGSMARRWNKILRRNPPIENADFEDSVKSEFHDDGEQLDRILEINSVLQNHNIPENIIVYRYTDKKVIKALCSSYILKKGMQFADNGFLSTTLVEHLLDDFAKKHHCDCLLKIYLPKGTKGAYVSIKNSLATLDEQEVLLVPNLQMEIVKVHYLSSPLLIECKIV